MSSVLLPFSFADHDWECPCLTAVASSVCSSNLNVETGCSSAEAPWGTLKSHQMHAHEIGHVFAASFFGRVVGDEVESRIHCLPSGSLVQ